MTGVQTCALPIFRDAPAEVIIRGITGGGGNVKAYDPAAMGQARDVLGDDGIKYCKNAYDAVEDADVMVIVTEWNQFRLLNLARCMELMKEPVLVDLRNVCDPNLTREMGFKYISVGRP